MGERRRLQCRDCRKSWTIRDKTDKPDHVELSDDVAAESRTVTTKSPNIKTLEELLDYSGIDLSVWQVDRHVVNSWEVTLGGNKTESGRPETYTNYQVKAWLSPRAGGVDPKADIAEMIADAKQHAPVYEKVDYTPIESGNLLEISLFDHHFGQLSWGDETGEAHYDTAISRDLAIAAVRDILGQASGVAVDRILLPIGNDFFNVNSMLNATAAGTPQSEDDRWKKTFSSGRKLWVEIIEMCRAVAPVDVVVIPGNHDEERTYYLGEVLSAWFHNCDEVHVDNSPPSRKYYRWGDCFIGYTHGDREPKGSLINIMATERPLDWSQTRFREWHKGHLHAAKAHAFQILDEERGVREWIMPSLVAIDDWHAGKGYSALRESIGMVWNKSRGKTAMYMYHPEETAA
jgi:hypothetical protein